MTRDTHTPKRFTFAALPALFTVICLALAGCLDTGPAQTMSAPGSVASTGFGELNARFIPGRDRALIQVSLRDRAVIAEAVLVMPDGSRVPADSIDSQENPAASASDAMGVSETTDYSLRDPTVPAPVQGFPQATTMAIGQTLSSAEIHIPNIETYNRNWAKAHIEITEDLASSGAIREIPAPAPIP